MTAHTRFRKMVAVVAGAFLASTALAAATVAPAAAGVSKHKHELSIYKVEKYVKLGGVGTDTTSDPSNEPSVSCYGGDIALDGMWMIRSVDKKPDVTPDPDEDPDFPSDSTSGGVYNDARDVYVKASYPDFGDQAKWNFKFNNRAYGDAQLTIYAVCISGYTQYTNGHRHQISVRNLFDYTTPTVANPYGWGSRTYWNSSGYGSGACNSDEYFVAPGFNFSGSVLDHRLVASYATNSGRSWAREFAASGFDNVELYGKCIQRRVLADSGHRHTIAMKLMPSGNTPASGHFSSIAASTNVTDWRDVTYACDQDDPSYHGYKAAVGMFFMGNFWEHTWFLGMEPRPKIRAFRFLNVHGWESADVRYGALCINTRTSNPTS